MSQEVVYDMCSKDIVNSFMEGYSGIKKSHYILLGTIMCYG